MGGRYYITGVQIGMLIAMADAKKFKDVLEIIKGIEEEQYICDTEEFKKRINRKKGTFEEVLEYLSKKGFRESNYEITELTKWLMEKK